MLLISQIILKMKNILAAVIFLIGFTFSNAQQVPPKSKSQKSLTVKKAPVNSTAKLKKDGTPDKRYKANQKLKKDGTPDKRFKSN